MLACRFVFALVMVALISACVPRGIWKPLPIEGAVILSTNKKNDTIEVEKDGIVIKVYGGWGQGQSVFNMNITNQRKEPITFDLREMSLSRAVPKLEWQSTSPVDYFYRHDNLARPTWDLNAGPWPQPISKKSGRIRFRDCLPAIVAARAGWRSINILSICLPRDWVQGCHRSPDGPVFC